MITQTFIQSTEYQEFKQLLEDEICNKPIKLKTEGKSNEAIAREVTAYDIASKMIVKVIKRFEAKVTKLNKEKQTYK